MLVGLRQEERGPAQLRVFLVDDEEHNLLLFQRSLKPYNYDLRCFRDGQEVLDALAAGPLPDLILSDVMMPRVNGYEMCETLKRDPRTAMVPIVLVTGLNEIKDKIHGLEAGADDFIHKPFHPLELRARVKSLLRIKTLNDQLEAQNQLLASDKLRLEGLVRERTAELEDLTIGLVAALEKANKMNDTDTGNHIKRVCNYSDLLARGLNLDPQMCLRIGRYASLHDVGKVAIPDHILKKPGKLTETETKEMRRHTVYGYELLVVAGADIIAQNIALCHHEWFDGTGYPYRLRGDRIPIEARIVALADVFDALTNKRCYKDAYSYDEAKRMILDERGRHFDPDIVDILLQREDEVHAIQDAFRDLVVSESLEEVTLDAPPKHLMD